MTPEEIDRMEAGPELDALIDERVFGKKWFRCEGVRINGQWFDIPTWMWVGWTANAPPKGWFAGVKPPARSAYIPMAWLVVEKMLLNKYWRCRLESDGDDWLFQVKDDPLRILGYSRAPTAPLAICRAALKAALEAPAC